MRLGYKTPRLELTFQPSSSRYGACFTPRLKKPLGGLGFKVLLLECGLGDDGIDIGLRVSYLTKPVPPDSIPSTRFVTPYCTRRIAAAVLLFPSHLGEVSYWFRPSFASEPKRGVFC